MTATAPGAARTGSDLARRTASGLLLAALVFGSLAFVPAFTVVILVVCLASLWELKAMTAREGEPLIFPVAASAIAAYIVLAAMNLQHAYEKAILGFTIIGSLAFSLGGSRQGFFARSAFTVFGVLYIGWLGSYFLALRNLPHVGLAYAAESIVAIAFTDIFAMLVGTSIGRTRMTSISPNKTWEGAAGGFLASTLVCASFAAAVPLFAMPWWQGAFVGALTSLGAQVGDLIESALKRDARVKDAGTLMAGHGGILDRYDSYTFGGIAFYAALYVTGHIAHP